MRKLNDEESWELLRREVFGYDQYCPTELVETGRNIARKCGGLPLAIVEIGKFLKMHKRTPESWEDVEKRASSVASLPTFGTFSISYNHLPYYLKPCFLYMGAFPKHYVIQSSKISQLWIAEGFITLRRDGNLEDNAKEYLEDLVQHQLLEVYRKEAFGKVKAYKLHDLWWEFCQTKAVEENFLWLKEFSHHNIAEDVEAMHRVSVHPLSQHSNKMKPMLHVRSFLCIGLASRHLAPVFLGSRLLKILDVFQIEFYQFPPELLELLLLKYLALSCHSDVPSSISRLRNLQTLIIRRLPSLRMLSLPYEMWEMMQLRHIKSKGSCMWYYPRNGKVVVQENLQTLSNIQMFGVTKKFLGKIPNVRKMGISCNAIVRNDVDLDLLHKLETLKCSSNWSWVTGDFLSYLKLPHSLRKLTLSLCRIPVGFMTVVGSLPFLEELKLQKSDFLGIKWTSSEPDFEPTEPEWEIADGEFPKLKSLLMENLNLVHWRVNLIWTPFNRFNIW